MIRGEQSKGRCAYCDQEMMKNQMTKHLSSCPQRLAAIAKAEHKKGGKESLYHLRAQDAVRKEFWLDLEMRGAATMEDLDDYLRGIWLECCGHMSQFSAGGWPGAEISKKRKADQVLKPGLELTHIYDFGTSSETLIKVMGMREGNPTTRHPIALMARNSKPEAQCIECDQPASHLCLECLYEHDVSGILCDEHARIHPHKEYGDPIPLVNSPRTGMCGYEGPAEPPY
jgi:hypothetical protein